MLKVFSSAFLVLLLVSCSKGKKSGSASPALSLGTSMGTFHSSPTLNVPVMSNVYDSYSYKVGEAGSIDCSDHSDYSSVVPMTTPINADLSLLPDGELKLCILAVQSNNSDAPPAILSSVWVKDTQAPTTPSSPQLGSVPVSMTDTPSLSWGEAEDNGPAGLGSYQVQIFHAADDSPASPLTPLASGESISGLSLLNGASYYFKVIAYDRAGNASVAAQSSTWTATDGSGPMAALSGLPTSSSTSLNVSVSNVLSYRYKFGLSTDVDCSDASGYTAEGSEITVATTISDSIDADGSYRLCVVGNDGIIEQPTGAATAHNWVKDTTAPVVLSVSSSAADGVFKAGDIIPITITFNETISLTGTPRLQLNTNAYASFSSATGSALIFNYTVGSGDAALDLEVKSSTALDLQGGSLKDAYTNSADLSLPTSGSNSLSGSKDFTVDASAPSAPGSFNDGTSSSSTTDSPTFSWNASTDTGAGVSYYELAIGSSSGAADLMGWTNIGNVTSYQASGLTLSTGNTYYASIRAVDGAGNTSTVALGNGWSITSGPVDCESTTPSVGSECLDGTLFAGVLSDAHESYRLMVTPVGCSDEATPTCGSGDDLTKTWGVRNVITPVKTYTYLTESSAPSASAKLAAQSNADAQAAKYCENMTYAGYSDWYLPNENELKYLTASGRASLFELSGFYWSSREEYEGVNAYRVGSGSSSQIGKSNLNKVRCVRRDALKLMASPTSLYDLQTVMPSTVSEWNTITISNPTSIKTKNLSTTITGTGLEINTGSNTCHNSPLSEGASCSVQVRISSDTDRLISGKLTVSDGEGFTLAIPLSGYVAVNCLTGNPVPGNICQGGIPFSGTFDYGAGDVPTMATPGGCEDATVPLCSHGTDYVTKVFATTNANHATNDFDGAANTEGLVSGWANTAAAKYCADMVFGGFDDWYLPAKDELNLLVTHKTAIGGFIGNYYWSSSQTSNSHALVQFNTSVMDFTKSTSMYVRCMRKAETSSLSAFPNQLPDLNYERPATSSPWRTVFVTNSTNAATLPLSLTTSSTTLEIDSENNSCTGAGLIPGYSCSFSVRISTSTLGKHSGFVTVSDANGTSVKIGVKGIVAADCFAATAPAVGSYCRGGVKYGGVSTNHRIMVAPAGCTSATSCIGDIDTLKKKFNSSYDPIDYVNGTTDDNAILNAARLATKTTTDAHKFCADLVYGGYDDWVLPAKNDLTTLYNNRSNIGGFASGIYWSSSEKRPPAQSYIYAAARSFVNGAESEVQTGTANFVRCIRKFH